MMRKCERCGKTMDDVQFYTYRDGSKTEMCKKCLTAHIDNFDPSTFVWLLQKMDVPYIEQEWNTLRDKAYDKDPNKINGMSVFGKYLAKMKLKQWKNYHWEDSDDLLMKQLAKEKEAEAEKKKEDEKVLKDFQAGKITEAEYKTLVPPAVQNKQAATVNLASIPESVGLDGSLMPIDVSFEEQAQPELTAEDVIYLSSKWGKAYTPHEWIELEKNYVEMTNSFDIQDADTINTLIIICKTNLKMNQAIDSGDFEGFNKLSKIYESLRKSAKFTAQQNKEEQGNYVDSIGELVTICEKEGFIPRFATNIPRDKVDLTLKDMNLYLKKLVTQDLGFGQQIEDALKKIKIQKEMNDMKEEEIKNDGDVATLMDTDYEHFYNDIEAQRKMDEIGEEQEEEEGGKPEWL